MPRAFKVLITLSDQIERKSVLVLAEEGDRIDLRINSLREGLGPGLAESVRTKIFARQHAANTPGKLVGRGQVDVFAALIHPVRAAAVEHPEIVGFDERLFAGPRPELAVLRPSARRPQLRAHGGIHAAIDGPIERIPQHEPFLGRGPEARQQEARFATSSKKGFMRSEENT